ncbi:NlpC/P60 family protein [Hoeflea poritis]|uniref:NlpC/P60 family protein n=1 Tax=Hoeflea poritis TaxID=2993659 RepID=A0ABT4VTB5_9HYPH|nr:NlpC/P60 family protein [Hoeflea poritis]MDA4847934.1 NlpC/P60 family protein [Hoeflea poritis]
MSAAPDRRLNAYRDDLADIALEGQVNAGKFVAGEKRVVAEPVLDMRDHPSAGSSIGTQALMGETVTVFEEKDGLSWVQLETDRYVGYVNSDGLAVPGAEPNHVVAVPRTFIYETADLRSPVRMVCSMGNRLALGGSQTTRGTDYRLLDGGGAVIAAHVEPLTYRASDYVAVAAGFLNTPYLWGGRSGFGLDCSGLVQLSLAMCGRPVPRDTDMQASGLGESIEAGPGYARLQRGDLVFWKGHVAIVEDERCVLHASGHAMQVVREPLSQAIDRIARLYGPPTQTRRP